MFTRITSRFVIAFLLAAALITPVVKKLAAQNQPPQGAPREAPQKDRFVVHEWGTFTSVSNKEGKPQIWSPLIGPSELPDFVYRDDKEGQRRCAKCYSALARMETPVLYFYADHKLDVSVKVDFPNGQITEWYPQARAVNPGINWGSFTVTPNAEGGFPRAQGDSHYYPARETDAAPVAIHNGQKTEYEKFLFYRGIGSFELPLAVRLNGDQVVVRNAGREEIANVILFENHEGRVGWRIHDGVRGEVALARPTLGQPLESLFPEIEKRLIAQGLYEKEAVAMINTWRDSWFEEGLRVFYLVPRERTDKIIPIVITPTPGELTRTLVGRAELLTPEMEMALQSAVKQFSEGTAESRAAAVKTVRRYGRFAQPALLQMMEQSNNNSAESPIWKLLVESTF